MRGPPDRRLHIPHDDESGTPRGTRGFRIGDETVTAGTGAHSSWNEGEARYPIVMSPQSSAFARALHAGAGGDFHGIFRRHGATLRQVGALRVAAPGPFVRAATRPDSSAERTAVTQVGRSGLTFEL